MALAATGGPAAWGTGATPDAGGTTAGAATGDASGAAIGTAVGAATGEAIADTGSAELAPVAECR